MTPPSAPTPKTRDPGAPRQPGAAAKALASALADRFVQLGLALVVGIALIGYAISEMERSAAFSAHESATLNLTRGMTAQTEQKLGDIDKALVDLSGAIDLHDVNDAPAIRSKPRAPATMNLLADRQIRKPGVVAFMVIDAEGRLAADSRGALVEGGDMSGRDFFLALRTGAEKAAYVGAPERNLATGAWSGFLARALRDADGRFAGVIAAEIALGDFQEFFRVAIPFKRAATVMRSDGVILVQYPQGVDRTGQKAPGLASHPLSPKGVATYHGPDLVDGAPVVAAVARMKTLPILVETSGAEAEALEDWSRERQGLAIGCVIAAAIVVGLLRLFAVQVRRLQASQHLLAVAHQQLDTALSNIPQGVCFFDGDRRLVVSNRRYWEVYGMPPDVAQPGATLEEIVDRRLQSIRVNNFSSSEYGAWIDSVVSAGNWQQGNVELSDGRTIAIQTQPMPEGGWVATHEDITERRRAEAKIAFLAEHDALTGVANRPLLMTRLEGALKDAERGKGFAVLFLDLDHFKSVNDALGHNVGDELLCNVAARLSATVRRGCTIARLGGDEFVIVQIDVNMPESCVALARRIIESIGAPYKIGPHEIVIGVSIGIEIYGPEARTADALLKHSDLALYLSKASGRGTFRFYEPEMDVSMRNRRQMEIDLRRAVAEKQFHLHFQPVVEAASGEVRAFETLLRWTHPTRGNVPPYEFIGVSEDNGLIVPIGEWVVFEACRQAALWPERIRIAVNVSPVQFRSAGFVPSIREALSASGLAPHRLEIEITETVLLQSDERNLAILHQLRDLGISIAMDDFGIGYSSLNYLRRFPFDKIKIDQSFVRDLTIKPEAVLFVRAIVNLCSGLGVATTVEGVETPEQLALLLEENCTYLQGYLLGRPCPAEQATEFISRGRLIPARTKPAAPPSFDKTEMDLAS